jgi:hypothetical protein
MGLEARVIEENPLKKISEWEFYGNVEGLIPMRGYDLRNVPFRIHKLNFANIDFSYSDIREQELDQAIFTGCDLSYTDITGTSCSGTLFNGATIEGITVNHEPFRDEYLPNVKVDPINASDGFRCIDADLELQRDRLPFLEFVTPERTYVIDINMSQAEKKFSLIFSENLDFAPEAETADKFSHVWDDNYYRVRNDDLRKHIQREVKNWIKSGKPRLVPATTIDVRKIGLLELEWVRPVGLYDTDLMKENEFWQTANGYFA